MTLSRAKDIAKRLAPDTAENLYCVVKDDEMGGFTVASMFEAIAFYSDDDIVWITVDD